MKKYLPILMISIITAFILIYFLVFSSGPPPNIIFISIDTLRQDHVGIYGYDRDTSPVIDDLASEGVWFRNSYSSAPWTLPSHMSMFTGLPPSVHNVDFDNKALAKGKKLFTEILRDSGYKTGGFFSAVYLKKIYGFSRGFDKYSNQIKKKAGEITDKAIEWIEPNKKEKFFLFLHYFDVHWPYRPPLEIAEKFDVDTSKRKWFRYGKLMFLRKFSDPLIKLNPLTKKKIVNLYDAEIFRVDRSIGRLISYLKKEGLYDNTVLVITSDHGEELKEHGSFGHFHQLYSELINVPLIIRYPEKIPGNSIVDRPVGSIDISTTLLKLASVKVPDQFKRYGIDLLNLIGKNKTGVGIPERILISESRKGGTYHFAAKQKGFKYITPYQFQPIIKKKKWIKVRDKLFKISEDRFDSDNLLLNITGEKSNSVILKTLKNYILSFVKKNISGIKIIFFPSEKMIEEKLAGKLILESFPEELPFGVNFSADDRLDADKENNSLTFELKVEKEKKEIIFPLTESLLNMKTITVKVRSGGKILLSKEVDLSDLKKPHLLFKGENGKGSIYIARNGKYKAVKKFKLSEKDIEALKTLGYIN